MIFLRAMTKGVLLKYWDPLNVYGNANLSDEYDEFMPDVYDAVFLYRYSRAEIEQVLHDKIMILYGNDPCVAGNEVIAENNKRTAELLCDLRDWIAFSDTPDG